MGSNNDMPVDPCHGWSCWFPGNASRGRSRQGNGVAREKPRSSSTSNTWSSFSACMLERYHRVLSSQGKHVRIIFVECKKPVHKAYLLGLAAAALLALAHALAHVRPCFCSRRRSDTSSSCRRGLSKAALIASWYILRPSYLSELA
ncbi:hypothetical protein BHE74_00007315 [Ensete ventricosum]|nr:hypothetical protein BHE74_00007315 [Ensete ventricosum]